jgi:hypothetical protein
VRFVFRRISVSKIYGSLPVKAASPVSMIHVNRPAFPQTAQIGPIGISLVGLRAVLYDSRSFRILGAFEDRRQVK